MTISILPGHAIKLGRAMRNLTQRQLAEAAGMKQHRLWTIENDRDRPRPDELAKILNALSTGDPTRR